MNTRKTFSRSEVSDFRIKTNRCPSCGLPKRDWKRRKDWLCCSTKCSKIYMEEHYKSWDRIRWQAFQRDNFTCQKCGYNDKDKKCKEIMGDRILAGDHIIPIALGGKEFDLNNVQTLCDRCHRIKSKEDIKKIAQQRRIEKQKKLNKTLILY